MPPCMLQGSPCVWAQPVRDEVTLKRRLSLAEPAHRMIPGCTPIYRYDPDVLTTQVRSSFPENGLVMYGNTVSLIYPEKESPLMINLLSRVYNFRIAYVVLQLMLCRTHFSFNSKENLNHLSYKSNHNLHRNTIKVTFLERLDCRDNLL